MAGPNTFLLISSNPADKNTYFLHRSFIAHLNNTELLVQHAYTTYSLQLALSFDWKHKKPIHQPATASFTIFGTEARREKHNYQAHLQFVQPISVFESETQVIREGQSLIVLDQ